MTSINRQGVSVLPLTTTIPKEAAHAKQVNLPKEKSIINLNNAPIERKLPVGIVDVDKEFASRGGTIGFNYLSPCTKNPIDLTLYRDKSDPSKYLSANEFASKYLSANLNSQNKTNLLTIISHPQAQNNMNSFIETLTDFTDNKSTEDLSNFLATAANSEKNLGKLLDITSEVDLAFTSELSTVDTINFLQAATSSDADIHELTSTTQYLDGKDRSNFLYAAGNTIIDASALIKETENLKGNIKSDYLLQMANYGQNTISNTAYMKGVLTESEYQNFEATISNLEAYEVDDFISVLTEQKGEARSKFLNATNTADESADKFILKFSSLIEKDQGLLLDLSSTLGEEDRKNLTEAFINKKGDISDLMNIIKDIQGNDSTGIGVEHFLKAAGNANSKDLDDLITITDKILTQFDTILSSIENNGNIGNFMDAVV